MAGGVVVGVDDLEADFLVGFEGTGVGGGDLGEEEIEMGTIELTVAAVEDLDEALAAPGFGDADLAHDVEALFAKRAAIVDQRAGVDVSFVGRRISGKALGGERNGVAGELVAIHDDDGRGDSLEGFEYRGSINPGDEAFARLGLRADIGGEVGVGERGDLI